MENPQDDMVREDEAGTSADGKWKKKNVRFSAGHDVLLLREVVAQNPYTAAAGEVTRTWAAIAAALNAAQASFNLDGRRCRDRTTLLVDYFRKEDFASLRRFALKTGDFILKTIPQQGSFPAGTPGNGVPKVILTV